MVSDKRLIIIDALTFVTGSAQTTNISVSYAELQDNAKVILLQDVKPSADWTADHGEIPRSLIIGGQMPIEDIYRFCLDGPTGAADNTPYAFQKDGQIYGVSYNSGTQVYSLDEYDTIEDFVTEYTP